MMMTMTIMVMMMMNHGGGADHNNDGKSDCKLVLWKDWISVKIMKTVR